MNWMAAAAVDSTKAFFMRLGNFLPTLFGVVAILLLGWGAAVALQRVLLQVLKVARADELADKIRVNDVLQKGDVRHTFSELLGFSLYWLIILATLLAALNALGLTVAAELLEKVLSYVPNVLAGVIILVLGLFFATLVGGVVQTATANAGIAQAKGLGQIARVVVIVFASVVALEKFFSSMVIQATFTVVVAAVSFGFALAFGLGCKDIAGKFVADFIGQVRRR